MQIPLFKVRDLEGEGRGIEKIGLYGGAQQIEHTKILFRELLEKVVEIASLQVQ